MADSRQRASYKLLAALTLLLSGDVLAQYPPVGKIIAASPAERGSLASGCATRWNAGTELMDCARQIVCKSLSMQPAESSTECISWIVPQADPTAYRVTGSVTQMGVCGPTFTPTNTPSGPTRTPSRTPTHTGTPTLTPTITPTPTGPARTATPTPFGGAPANTPTSSPTPTGSPVCATQEDCGNATCVQVANQEAGPRLLHIVSPVTSKQACAQVFNSSANEARRARLCIEAALIK